MASIRALLLSTLLLAGCASAVRTPQTAAPAPPEQPQRMGITGTRWLWLGTTTAAGLGGPPPAQLYWIQFDDTRRASVRADCNRGFADIRVEAGSLSFPRVALTRRSCGEGSLDDRFVRMLETVESAFVEDGRLRLGLAARAGVMDFAQLLPTPYSCEGDARFVAWSIAGSHELLLEHAGRAIRLAPAGPPQAGAGASEASVMRYEGGGVLFEVDGRAATVSGAGLDLGRCRMAPTGF